jgi:hypothetical protein
LSGTGGQGYRGARGVVGVARGVVRERQRWDWTAFRALPTNQVLLRLVRGPGRAWLDLRGLTYLQLPVPDET